MPKKIQTNTQPQQEMTVEDAEQEVGFSRFPYMLVQAADTEQWFLSVPFALGYIPLYSERGPLSGYCNKDLLCSVAHATINTLLKQLVNKGPIQAFKVVNVARTMSFYMLTDSTTFRIVQQSLSLTEYVTA